MIYFQRNFLMMSTVQNETPCFIQWSTASFGHWGRCPYTCTLALFHFSLENFNCFCLTMMSHSKAEEYSQPYSSRLGTRILKNRNVLPP